MSESGGMSFDADWSAPRTDSKDQWWNIALGNNANYGEAADAYVQELLKNNGVITPGMDALKAEGWRRGYFQEPKKGDFLSQYAPLIIGGLALSGASGLLGGLGDAASLAGADASAGLLPEFGSNLAYDAIVNPEWAALEGADASAGLLPQYGTNAAYDAGLSGSKSWWEKALDSVDKPGVKDALSQALKAFGGSAPQLQGYQVAGSSSPTNAVNSSTGTQSTLLANPTAQQEQLTPMQSDQTHIGFIDPNPANNTFLQAGSTWNPRMAAALRTR